MAGNPGAASGVLPDRPRREGSQTAQNHEHKHEHDDGHAHGGGGHVHVGGAQLKIAFILNIAIVLVQVVGGLMAHSLALLSDAGHNAADAFAIGLAWFAQVQAERRPTAKMSYGFHRAGILVALANSLSLVAVAVVITWEGYRRILHPEPVNIGPMLITAVLALAFNAYAAFGLRGDKDVNIRSAFLHLLGDAAASAGVIVAGVVILFTGWFWLDPVLSMAIAVLIAIGAWDVVRRTIHILMEGTPEQVDPQAVMAAIRGVEGVESVHDVHIWSLAAGRNALSCHMVVGAGWTVRDVQPLLDAVSRMLRDRFKISHTTLQVEPGEHGHGDDCCGV